ncbi:MAG: adenylate kinase [Planctomycetes bacterium GWF2_41_51]|nr:MAG: adenylate kinase [Planctomycetes bacterium GWF2_41_51]HBG27752.1 adenylate kinase [Phycisphaerales bacterium]
MVIVLLGPPGAGKGTQCKRIAEKYKLVHLSSGDILRLHRANGTELGKKAAEYMDSGKLVPDQLIIEMMACAIESAKGNCVLDGFPRTVVQAKELDIALDAKKRKIDAIVDLVIDDSVIENRMTGRRSCPACGTVYHVETLKPKLSGICDSCGVKLVQRTDDKPEVVRQRLETYHQQTAAVTGYYADKGHTILDIDAGKSVDEVTAKMIEKLDRLSMVR